MIPNMWISKAKQGHSRQNTVSMAEKARDASPVEKPTLFE
jgi:hypothetical protein